LAVVIAALIGAAEMVRSRHEPELATFLEEQADWLESHLEDWTATNDGVLMPGVKQHYMRIRPVEAAGAEACMHMGPGRERVILANRAPGEQYAFEAREIVDGGFLELVRYGLRRPDDPTVVATVKVADAILRRELPQGPGFRRYNHDGYGNHKDGSPFDHWGQGSCWPMLTGERAHYELAAGRDISALIKTIEGFCSPGGMLPEQVWDRDDLPQCRMWKGRPTGSAMPLVWAHAEYIKLLRSATDKRVFDRLDAVAERYAKPRARGTIEVWRRDRQVRRMEAKRRLRVEADEIFELRWSADGWRTAETTRATAVDSCGFYADARPGSGERLEFTLYWPERGQWEGQNYSVMVER
jgi:glucoamylase